MSPLRLQLNPDGDDPHAVIGRYTLWEAFQVFKRYLEPEGDLSLEEGSSLLYQMMPEPGTKSSYELRDLCFEFPRIAKQIPYSHPSQVKLVKLLERLGKSDRFNKLTGTEKYAAYRSLDDYHEEAYRHAMEFYHETDDEAKETINFCAFAARLASAGIADTRAEMTLWLSRILEDGHYSKSSAAACTCVSVCAVWVLCGGQYLFNQLVLYPDQDLTADLPPVFKPGEDYHGPALGLERWNFWQRKFAEIAEGAPVDDEARQLARKAADFMAALARDVLW